MPYPLIPKKYKYSSLVSPERLVKNKGKSLFPSRVILCFSKETARSLRKTQYFKKTMSLSKALFNMDLYTNKQSQKKILRRSGLEFSAVRRSKARGPVDKNLKNLNTIGITGVLSDFGIGAPAGVVCLETLRAGGTKEIISLGAAGSLNPNLKTGAKVLIAKAFRDEGCSYHYKAPSPYIKAPRGQSKLLKKIKLKSVASWTTDAPYRETKEEFLYFQSKGVECVEMESAALMAAGEYYGLSVLCLGVVSDHLSAEKWTPQFSHPAVKKSLYELLNQILFL